MGKILTILYLISAIYVIWLFFKLILSIKSKTYDDTTSKFANRYTGLLLVLSMMIFCLSLSITVKERIPEATYHTNGILKIGGDDNRYSVSLKVDYYVDVDYIEDVNHDYLFDGGISDKKVIDERFCLIDITSYPNETTEGFLIENIERMPEYIASNEEYDIEFYGHWNEPYLENIYSNHMTGKLIIPPLTKENLGVTLEEQIEDVSVISYAEHIILFVLAGGCLLLCKKR